MPDTAVIAIIAGATTTLGVPVMAGVYGEFVRKTGSSRDGRRRVQLAVATAASYGVIRDSFGNRPRPVMRLATAERYGR